ncbi:MAG: DnaA/Hda family protein [Candidatus Hydrogenedentes bacterium]|nr:DnaA/Hda family protein [Candidatus Hydrogenedentota bacterium]
MVTGTGQGASKRLGEILVEEGLINDLALEEALAEQRKTGGFIVEILVEKGFAKQSDILHSLVKQCKIPHLSLIDYDIHKDLLPLIPKEICFKYNLLPIDKLGRILTVAMVNPLDDEALAEVRKVCPELRIKPILCDWQHFDVVASRIFNEPRKAKAGAYDDLSTPAPSKPTASKPAGGLKTPPPAAAGDAAMQAAVNKVIKTAGASEQPAGHGPGPGGAAATQDMVASLRDGLAGALQDALGPLVKQLGEASARPNGSDAGGLGEAVREAVRDVLRENESIAVARSNRLDLEMRDREKEKRLRHGAANPTGATKRGALDVLQNTELREEADQRVAAGLSSDRLLEEYTFESFLVGAANAFTYKICRAVAERPGGEYNPLFIYGEVGLGKTHLIHATGNAIVIGNPDARVGCVSASRFATRLMEAQSEGAVKIFRDNYCHWDVLILDDIQFLGGRVEAQEEFFHIFNVLQQEGRQIIIAGDKPPDRLGMLENRLVSRFAGGIVVNLKPPEFETRVAILRHAVESGAAVDEKVLSLVATRIPGDIRKMLGALRKIQAFADLEKKPVSSEMAGEILTQLGIDEAA